MSFPREGNAVPMEKQKPFTQEEERAVDVSIDNNEIGLLDVVILDAFASGDVCHR